MYRYIVVKEMLHTPELGRYESFGIQVLCRTPNGWAPGVAVSDVSLDATVVETLTQLCTREQLDPVQLSEVVLDWLEG